MPSFKLFYSKDNDKEFNNFYDHKIFFDFTSYVDEVNRVHNLDYCISYFHKYRKLEEISCWSKLFILIKNQKKKISDLIFEFLKFIN